MGAVVRCKLPVVTALPRMCRVFASNNKMIHFEREFKAQFEILPGANNVVYYSLRGYKPGTEKIAINVVDNNSKELIQGWTLRVTTLPPNPDQTFSERVSVNKIELIAKPFLNRLNEYARYEIEASNPALLDVKPP
jgi:hypothetical protein